MIQTIDIAQIEIVTGDIQNNKEKIIDIYDKSTSNFIVYPELALSGYNCGNLFETPAFLKDIEDAIDDLCKATANSNKVMIVGAPYYSYTKSELYNSAYIISNGKIDGIYNKIHLANDDHHEDKKYFTPGTDLLIKEANDLKYSVIICEDAWNDTRDLYDELRAQNVELIFDLNFSYATKYKLESRKELFKNKTKSGSYNHNIIPTIYVNAVGLGDIVKNYVVYDGHSMVINKHGDVIQQLDGFKEDIRTIKFSSLEMDLVIEKTSLLADDKFINQDKIKVYDKYEYMLNTSIYAIKSLFDLSPYLKNAQVHISGGIDSAVVAYIVKKALNDRVIFISQPSKNNSSTTKGFAEHIAKALDVELEWDSIENYITEFKSNNPDASPIEVATFEATMRSSLGLAACHKNKSAIIACGNHTENALGFFTFHDIGSIGAIQPIGDYTKQEVYEVAKYINESEDREIIPKELYDGSFKPSAELEDNQGEDPYDYSKMSIICSEIVRHNSSIESINKRYGFDIDEIKKVKQLINNTTYKRAQSAPVLIINNRSFGFSMRDTLINKYK